MARLDRPLFSEEATGTLARVLAFRRTANWGQAAQLPGSSCPPSASQVKQRTLYAAAIAAWHALPGDTRGYYNTNKPANLSGYNFFIRLHLFPSLSYLGYCIFGTSWFQLTPDPDQPTEVDFDKYFPEGTDEVPTMRDGADSPQAWIVNRIYDTIVSIQDYLILHKATIEGG